MPLLEQSIHLTPSDRAPPSSVSAPASRHSSPSPVRITGVGSNAVMAAAISSVTSSTTSLSTNISASSSSSSLIASAFFVPADTLHTQVDGSQSAPNSRSPSILVDPESLNSASSSTGQMPDELPQITEALRGKDRIYVLKLGEMMESLINERRARIDLTPATSYQRLLVHRCSAYYRLTPESDPVTKSIIVHYTSESRIPPRRICELVPPENITQPVFKIIRRSPSDRRSKPQSQAGSVAGEDADSSDVEPSEAGSVGGRSNATGGSTTSKKRPTIEEREAAYNEARSRIFMDFQEKEKEKEKDMSASSSSLSLVSGSESMSGGCGSSVDDRDDPASSPATESEWSGPVSKEKDSDIKNGPVRRGSGNTSAASSSSRSFRSSAPSFTASGSSSSRGSRAPSPGFTYASLYEPAPVVPTSYGPNVHPYHNSQASIPVSHGSYYYYPPPAGQPPSQPYPSPYPYYPPYPYPHPPHMQQHSHSDPTTPAPSSTAPGSETYPHPPPGQHLMYGHPPYGWHPVPPPGVSTFPPPQTTHQNLTQLQSAPEPSHSSPFNDNASHSQQHPPVPSPFPIYMHHQYPYPMPGYCTPPTPLSQPQPNQPMHNIPPQPTYDISFGGMNGISHGHVTPQLYNPSGSNSNNSSVSHSRTSSRSSMSSGMMQGNGGGGGLSGKNRSWPVPSPNRPTWSYGPGVGANGPYGGDVVGPRLSSRRMSGTSMGSSNSGSRSSAADEASSTASSSTSSSSRRTYTSTSSSQHPLPARPDWAVGLKPQPSLASHHNRHHDHIYRSLPPSRTSHQNPGCIETSANVNRQQEPTLHLTDFPPLSTNEKEKRAPVVAGAWTNVSSTRSILMPPPRPSTNGQGGSALLNHASGLGYGGNINTTHGSLNSRLEDADRGFERPPPRGPAELFNPKLPKRPLATQASGPAGGGNTNAGTPSNGKIHIDKELLVEKDKASSQEKTETDLVEQLGSMSLDERVNLTLNSEGGFSPSIRTANSLAVGT